VLIGGAPLRVLRLTSKGAETVDSWVAGRPVGRARRLATRLVDSGLAHPSPPLTDPPRVAIVIPVRDDRAGLDSTLRALGGSMSVIVVDDGSTEAVDAAATLIRREEPGGPAAARNEGWRRAADVDVVVFVDAACELSSEAIDVLLRHFADPAVAAVAPRVKSQAAQGFLALYEQHHSPLDLGTRPAPVRPHGSVPYVPTAVLAVRRSALEALGGFDESMRFGEDVDFVWRLDESGWRVRYEPAASASHPPRSTWRAWLRQRFEYGRSATALAQRHRRAVAPLAVSPWSAAAWAFLAAGQLEPALAIASGSGVALARRAGDDWVTAVELLRLAGMGNLRAGASIARAVRRAWLPPAAAVLAFGWQFGGRKLRRALVLDIAAMIGMDLAAWWSERPGSDPVRWAGCRLADDLAYQTGVWAGVWDRRSLAAILPDW
jgi:mycofactocin system glycosyltransferase